MQNENFDITSATHDELQAKRVAYIRRHPKLSHAELGRRLQMSATSVRYWRRLIAAGKA